MTKRTVCVVLSALVCFALVPIGSAGALMPGRSIDGEFPVSLANYGQVQPAIDYPWLVYKSETEDSEEYTDIWAYNLATGQTVPVCTVDGEQSNPSVYDGKVVYSDSRNASSACDIYLYDLETGTETTVSANLQEEGNPFIWKDKVVFNFWSDTTSLDTHMVDLDTMVESTVAAAPGHQEEPSIWEQYACWHEQRDGNHVRIANVLTATETIVTTGTAQYEDPMVGDGVVVYQKQNAGFNSIQMYDIATARETTISSAFASNRWHPEVRDGWVVWQDNRNGLTEVWGYDMSSDEETRLVASSAAPYKKAGRATVGGGWIAWHDHRDEFINDDGTSYDDLYVKWIGGGDAATQAMPLEGENRYETATRVSMQSFPEGSQYAVIATGRNWPDALAGSSLAGAYGAPVLLVEDGLAPEVADELERLGVENAFILGGEVAIPAAVETELESLLETDVPRIGGVDRYETACMIASETVAAMGEDWDGNIFAATGQVWADALAVSPLAAFSGTPVLLAGPDGFDAGTEACMADLGVEGAVVLGGSVAMPVSVLEHVSALGVTEVDRVGGDDRYETAALIADWGVTHLGMSYDTVGIATGLKFPDALTCGVACGLDGFPMMLTSGTSLSSATEDALTANADYISQVRFAGGPSTIAPLVRTQVLDCLH